MENIRFVRFAMLLGGVQKSLQKIKWVNANEIGVKGVHVFWLYELKQHPEGRTASELAADSMVDRSLVSREINALKQRGYVCLDSSSNGKAYNRKIRLTPSGEALAEQIGQIGVRLQEQADRDIAKEDLEIFYATLEKLYRNFLDIAEEPEPLLNAAVGTVSRDDLHTQNLEG